MVMEICDAWCQPNHKTTYPHLLLFFFCSQMSVMRELQFLLNLFVKIFIKNLFTFGFRGIRAALLQPTEISYAYPQLYIIVCSPQLSKQHNYS